MNATDMKNRSIAVTRGPSPVNPGQEKVDVSKNRPRETRSTKLYRRNNPDRRTIVVIENR